MKKFYIFIFILAMLFFIICFILYPLLPNTIPIHWNGVNGDVDNESKKIAILIIPISLLISSLLFLYLDKNNRKKI